MHHSSRVVRRPQPFTVRTVVAMIAAAVLALLTVACGGGSSSGSGGSSSTGGSSNARSAEPFSVCMRSHGVSRYPDPDPKTPGFPALVRSARSVGVSAATLQAAERACYRTLPIDASKLDSRSLAQCEYTGDCPRALVQQAMTQLENFARCMRSHGVPRWPDPTIGSNGSPGFQISISKDGFNPYWSQIQDKANQCARVEHPDLGGAPIAVSS